MQIFTHIQDCVKQINNENNFNLMYFHVFVKVLCKHETEMVGNIVVPTEVINAKITATQAIFGCDEIYIKPKCKLKTTTVISRNKMHAASKLDMNMS